MDLVSTQREDPIEVVKKVVADVKEAKRRAKEEWTAKKRAAKSKNAEKDGDGDEDEESDGTDVDGVVEEKEDKKEKKRKEKGQ